MFSKLIFALPSLRLSSYHSRVQRSSVLLTTAVSLAVLATSPEVFAQVAPEERIVINRIVAIVDGDAITLRELERRMEPIRKRLDAVAPDKRAAAEKQMLRDLVQQIIDDRLIAREARALKVSITTADINASIDAVAAAKKLTREKVIQLVAEQGFSEAQYREQIVRQLLLGKLIRIRMADKVKGLDSNTDKANQQLAAIEQSYLQVLRANVYIEVRL